MADRLLGRLERIDLRNIWASEAADFTPWLARPENLEILGDTLVIDLDLEAQEKLVGPFRADILCKDIGTDQLGAKACMISPITIARSRGVNSRVA